ncbi:MAG: TldD/PmbA family protein [Armatimonadota bacterium]
MRDRVTEAIKKSPADYTEIRVERQLATQVSLRGPNLEAANTIIDTGGFVRCLYRDSGWGIATFNSLDDLQRRISQAAESARAIAPQEPVELASVEPSVGKTTCVMQRDFREVPLSEKKALAEAANEAILGFHDNIQDSRVHYSDSFTEYVYANSEGAYIEEERPLIGLYVAATARNADDVQEAHEYHAGVHGFEVVQGKEALAEVAAKRAVDLLSAETIEAGTYTVIADQLLAAVFAHEAFGHLSESDFVYDNPQAREMMTLGRRFGSEILNIVDDGARPGLRGSHPFDDEGTRTQRTDLVREGVLVGRLHSRETAAKMGESPTGNARATGYRYPPIVRMTNTLIEPGTTSFDDMLSDVKLGVYACHTMGGQTALENFSFSAAWAHVIRNGRIQEMVKDVILSGNLFDTLGRIDAIGNDFEWAPGGTCGKSQGGLPVGMGAPHIRIREVLMGGR